jgi:tetratricopeptide (TPR) repeat protein
MGLGALFLIYTLYARFFGPKTAKEVYNSHFDAPQSLVEDATTRTQNLPVLEDSLSYAERPPVCDEILTQADEYYKNKAYADAASILAEALDEEALSPCHSDACFYLGIIGLQLDRPMMTVQFFAKIEDLDRYGEDIYWFQALAYVKMAAQNEVDKELARRAVERARDNTEIPERREEAERILKELGQ